MDVRLEGLTKVFTSSGHKETVAVNNMNMTIPDGHLMGLLGPSGCGKSTTLFLLAGLYEPTEGKIFFGDDDVTALPPERRGIGLVFQNYALYPHMTVYDNIAFPLRNSKSFKASHPVSKERRDAIDEIVRRTAKIVAIEEYLERRPAQLSGGQQQRVAIARAIAKSPRVLLLDEPLSNLDARLRMQTRDEIRRIQQETGITTVFVTHDQEEAMSITDEIVVMKDGVIQQMGKPQYTYDHPENAFVAQFLGNPPINLFGVTIEGGSIIINGERTLRADAPDGNYLLGIRPESFVIADGDSAQDAANPVLPGGTQTAETLSAKVEYKATVGRDSQVRFYLNDKYSEALIESGMSVEVGDTLRFRIKRNGLHLFNTDGAVIDKW